MKRKELTFMTYYNKLYKLEKTHILVLLNSVPVIKGLAKPDK